MRFARLCVATSASQRALSLGAPTRFARLCVATSASAAMRLSLRAGRASVPATWPFESAPDAVGVRSKTGDPVRLALGIFSTRVPRR